MRQRIARIGRWGAGLVLALAAVSAWAGEVLGLRLEQGATGTRAEVQLQGAGSHRTLSLTDPYRLVLDLPDSRAARALRLPAPAGVVTGVRTGQPVPGTFRIVFELAAPVAALPVRTESTPDGAKLVVEWPGDGPATAAASTAPAAAEAAPAVDPQEAARATALLTAQVATAAAAPASPPAAAPASSGQVSPQAILEGRVQVPLPSASTPAGAPATAAAPVPAQPEPARSEPAPPPAKTMVTPGGMRPLIVAIDAGHGGQDPGAIGPSGKREKDVTLAMARELARQVNATPGMKAFLVRDSDVFIPLPMRAQRARQAKADIFISIHADAAENRDARGSSVYVLSTKGASSQRARWLADKENAADLVGGVRLQQTETVLANVLLDLAQSGHMRASEDAAHHVLAGLKRVGNNHKPNIERANFAVLRTADMPAMLVETAFISNPEEEKRLTDPAFQRKVASAVLDGINTYFTRQPPPGTLFAARAQAESVAVAAAGGGTP
ncbi:MAG: N-acetylmuramoyl-L-alanine amidase [Lysobacteraceae bacterium]|jgi:N-acetylmuramoyl-L-alanine amidase|nr:N-acetylmuramoyl-L-alanine amidase [Xanthomonadaceae bacterium]